MADKDRTMNKPNVKGGRVLVSQLVYALGELNHEMVVRVGDDGCLYFAHRAHPDQLEGKLDLMGNEPKAEQIGSFILGKDIFDSWLDRDR